jgi:hypothetical protein
VLHNGALAPVSEAQYEPICLATNFRIRHGQAVIVIHVGQNVAFFLQHETSGFYFRYDDFGIDAMQCIACFAPGTCGSVAVYNAWISAGVQRVEKRCCRLRSIDPGPATTWDDVANVVLGEHHQRCIECIVRKFKRLNSGHQDFYIGESRNGVVIGRRCTDELRIGLVRVTNAELCSPNNKKPRFLRRG